MTDVSWLPRSGWREPARLQLLRRRLGIELGEIAFGEALYLLMRDHPKADPTDDEIELAKALAKNAMPDAVRYLNTDIPEASVGTQRADSGSSS